MFRYRFKVMRKAYFNDNCSGPAGVEFLFSLDFNEAAYHWSAREQAEEACKKLNSCEITVSWAEGEPYVCKNFRVEQDTSRRFVVFCEGPFTALIPSSDISIIAEGYS